jgi:hypothetical protein
MYQSYSSMRLLDAVQRNMSGVASATSPVFLQQDGAPPHLHREVRKYLNTRFAYRWLGRAGPMSRQLRSTGLTPLHFSLWWFVKGKVYLHICLQMLMIHGKELQAQLQKSRQTCFFAPEKKFILGMKFFLLHLEVSSTCNCCIPDKMCCVWLYFYVFAFYLPLWIGVHILSNL